MKGIKIMKLRRNLIIMFFILVGIILVFLVLTQVNKRDLEKPMLTKVNNLQGVAMSPIPSTITPNRLALLFGNTGEYTNIFGSSYFIEIKIDDQWYKMPFIIDFNNTWNMEAYDLGNNSEKEWQVNWEWL